MTFARGADQIVPLEHSITRMAVTTHAEAGNNPPRDFSDYRIDLDRTKIPAGIVIDEKI